MGFSELNKNFDDWINGNASLRVKVKMWLATLTLVAVIIAAIVVINS